MLKPYRRAEVGFDLRAEIGQSGRNSHTYRSHDHQLDAEIVIKEIAKSSIHSSSNFFDESKALYASSHPHVVQIHYACEDADSVYLAMPFYARGSLKEQITDRHMTVREVVVAGCQILSGLHNIHSKRLIHFDIKPDNILFSDRGDALLSDFGLAKQMNFVGVAPQDRHYTPMIPPEATRTHDFDLRFDIYQFGMTLYRMCVGNNTFYTQLIPYGRGSHFNRLDFRNDVRNERFPDRRAFPPHVPERLRRIVRTCIKAEPNERYSTALECANALAAVDGTTLDWRLEEHRVARRWTKNENGTYYELSVDSSGASSCLKTAGSGQSRRVADMCRASVSESELKKFFGSY